MSEVVLRPPRAEDAPSIAALFNADAVALGVPPDVTAEQIATWWIGPTIDAAIDVVVAEVDRRIVGYGDLFVRGDDVRLDIAGAEAEETLLDELERRAGGRGAYTHVVLHDGDPFRGFLEQRGYRAVRASYDMEIPLDDSLAPPAWPASVEPRAARPGDERAFYRVQEDAFADHWGYAPRGYEEWAHLYGSLRPFDPELWLIAEDAGEPAGIAICEGGREGDERTGWVHVLAVRRPWRGRGLGSALLRWSFVALRGRGLERAALGVDAENTTGAVRLYERAGMQVTHRFEHWQRPL